MMINGVEREPRPAWTARSAGAKPAKLDDGSWLAEVVTVIDGTGVAGEQGKWWTEVILPRLAVCESSARVCAQEAAEAWYEETDQSGGACTVVLRVTAWTGKAWTVEARLEWKLTATVGAADRVKGGDA